MKVFFFLIKVFNIIQFIFFEFEIFFLDFKCSKLEVGREVVSWDGFFEIRSEGLEYSGEGGGK